MGVASTCLLRPEMPSRAIAQEIFSSPNVDKRSQTQQSV